jgi:hypothetical protein
MRSAPAFLLATMTVATMAAVTPSAAAQTFDFETTPNFTTMPFPVTSGGLTATFTSPVGFMVQPSPFSTLTGRVLMESDPTAGPLTILFSAPLNGISLRFGLNSPFAPASLTLQALMGVTLVGSVSAPGAVPTGFLFPEGSIAFAGATFNSVVLSSAAPDFAVDDIVARQASVVPEPATVWLFGSGALLVAGVAARRRRPRG